MRSQKRGLRVGCPSLAFFRPVDEEPKIRLGNRGCGLLWFCRRLVFLGIQQETVTGNSRGRGAQRARRFSFNFCPRTVTR